MRDHAETERRLLSALSAEEQSATARALGQMMLGAP
jgi:hypothetical protein